MYCESCLPACRHQAQTSCCGYLSKPMQQWLTEDAAFAQPLCKTSTWVARCADAAADAAEPPASAAMAESLRAHAAPVLQLCLRLHPLDAARALRAVPKLAPVGGWALPTTCNDALERAEREPSAEPNPGPTASQQAAVAVCLLQGLWESTGSGEPGAEVQRSDVQGVPSPGRICMDSGNPACMEALVRVAGACMATLAASHRQRSLCAEARSCSLHPTP